MEITRRPSAGAATASQFIRLNTNPEPREVRYFRLTFPEPGKILLKIGPGDHTVQTFELSKDDLRGLVRDAIPQLL